MSIEFILQLIEMFSDSLQLKSILEGRALDIFGYAQERGWMSEKLYLTWISILETRIKEDSNEDVALCVHICNLGVDEFPTSKLLWHKRLELAILPFDSWSLPLSLELLEIIRGVFVKAIPANSFSVWSLFIKFCFKSSFDFAIEIGKQHLAQMLRQELQIPEKDLEELFAFISMRGNGRESSNELISILSEASQVRPSAGIYGIWIDLLIDQISEKKGSKDRECDSVIKEIRFLFEKCLLLEEKSVKYWKKYIEFELNFTSDMIRVSSINGRAMMSLGFSISAF